MAEAADAVAEGFDLIVTVVRCAGETGAALDQLLDRRGGLFDRIAVPIPDEAATLAARFEHRDVGGKRVVAGRVGERLGPDWGGADVETKVPTRWRRPAATRPVSTLKPVIHTGGVGCWYGRGQMLTLR